MKPRMCLICCIFLSCVASLAWCGPAFNVQLGYDVNKHILHIDADHPTDRLDRYFIQKVVVIKNSGETQDFYFSRQTRPDKFLVDLNYTASVGDHLDVKLYSSEGGIGQGSFDIPMPSLENNAKQKTVSDRKE